VDRVLEAHRVEITNGEPGAGILFVLQSIRHNYGADGRGLSPRARPVSFYCNTIVNPINLAQKLSLFSDHWHPRIVGELNGQHVKLTKLQGEFVWHDHADEDELFLVLKGRLRMEFRDHTVEVGEGEMIIVPRGVEHRPIADEETHVMLFEPASTKHTGDVETELTRHVLERI
jgi:mannose-6-phosphate isomerase-like protein (cupin superfamily)